MKRNKTSIWRRTLSCLLMLTLLSVIPLSLVSCSGYTETNDGTLLYRSYRSDPDNTCRVAGLVTSEDPETVVVPSTAPDGKTVIGIDDDAFNGHFANGDVSSGKLYAMQLPETITFIGARAFYGSSYLYYINIPDAVQSIGKEAFYLCVYLQTVSIPQGVERIEASTFWNCCCLTSIVIPDSVTYIGPGAFQDCISLTSVTIPGSVKEIGDCAFGKDTSLTSVTIPDSVKSIGWMAFHGCSALTAVNYAGTQKQWNKICDGALFNTGAPVIHCSDGDVAGELGRS